MLEFLRLDGRALRRPDQRRGRRQQQQRAQSLLEVAQTISLLSTLSEREQDQNVLTLSTLHASKGLEWPHVMLVGVNEGLLPFKLDKHDELPTEDDAERETRSAGTQQRLEEERRLMYVASPAPRTTLAVSWTRRRKKGREMVASQPSRFIGEMALDKSTAKEDPREKLKACAPNSPRKPRPAQRPTRPSLKPPPAP